MEWIDLIRTLIEVALGGGLVVTLVTIKATRRKANTEAKQADMDLAKSYVDEFRENVVEPLQREIKSLKREIKSLKNAVQKVSDCPHADNCPVRTELQKQQGDDEH